MATREERRARRRTLTEEENAAVKDLLKSSGNTEDADYEERKRQREERIRRLRSSSVDNPPDQPPSDNKPTLSASTPDPKPTVTIVQPTATLSKSSESESTTPRRRSRSRPTEVEEKPQPTTPDPKTTYSSKSDVSPSATLRPTHEPTSPRHEVTSPRHETHSPRIEGSPRRSLNRTATSLKDYSSKSIQLYVIFSGIFIDDSDDELRSFQFEHDATIETVVKTIVRKSYLKIEHRECTLLYHSSSELEEASSDSNLHSLGIKNFDTVYLVPRTTIYMQLPEGSTETFRIDFSTPVINVLSIVANMLGWESIEEFLLCHAKNEKDHLELKKSFYEQGIEDGDTLILSQQREKAAELKKKVRKKKLISFLSKKYASSNQEYRTPQITIQDLKERPSTAGIILLQGSLALSSNWSNEFIKQHGLNVLFDMMLADSEKIEYYGKDDNHLRFLDKLVHTIMIALSNENGLESILKVPQACRKLTSLLDPETNIPGTQRKKMVLGILTAVCHVSEEGYNSALDALEHYAKVKHEKDRLDILVDSLSKEAEIPLKVANLTLINAIISRQEELQARMHIRDEFVKLGLSDVLKRLNRMDDDLDAQITLWETDRQMDQEELNAIAHGNIDLEDIDAVFKALKKQCTEPQKFLGVLQRTLHMSDVSHSNKLWGYLETVTDKISHLPPDQTLDDLYISHSDFAQVRHGYDQRIDTLQNRVRELEQGKDNGSAAKIAQLELQLNRREQELELLKLKLKEAEEQLDRRAVAATTSSAPADAPPPPPPGVDEPPPPPPLEGPPPPPGMSDMDGPPPPPLPPGGPPGLDGPPPPPLPEGGPPPPPGMFGGLMNKLKGDGIPGLPNKPVIKPTQKMKHLAWKKIPNNKILATIWSEAKEEIDLDISTVEGLFSAKPATMKPPRENQPEKKQLVSILDPKRANHVGIGLGKLKKSVAELKSAIIELNDKSLTLEELQSVKTMLPTPEELTMLREYPGDKSSLDKPEQFFLELEGVPNLTSRVNNWLFMRTFEEKAHEILPQIITVIKAFKESCECDKFLKLLQIVLAIGNYLNGNTSNGRAYGFKLDVLLKLSDTKSQDGKQTLLQYIIHMIEHKYPEILEFWNDMSHILPASKISSIVIREEIQAMRVGVQKATDEMEGLSSQDIDENSLNYTYLTRLKLFCAQAKRKFQVVSEENDLLNKEFKALCLKFGEDPETYKWEEFFALLLQFNEQFEKAKNDNMKEIRKSNGGGGGLRTKPKPKPKVGGVDDVLQANTPTKTIERNSIRRAKSIRMKATTGAAPAQNLNNFLDMLDKMKQTN